MFFKKLWHCRLKNKLLKWNSLSSPITKFHRKYIFLIWWEVKFRWHDVIQCFTLTIHVELISLLFESFPYFTKILQLLSNQYQVFQPIPILNGVNIQKFCKIMVSKFLWSTTVWFLSSKSNSTFMNIANHSQHSASNQTIFIGFINQLCFCCYIVQHEK